MKKYIFMFVAMLAMAVMATSCSKDNDDPTVDIKIIPTLVDPNNELTAQQKAAAEALVASFGTAEIKVSDVESLRASLIDYLSSVTEKGIEFILENPAVVDTKAGVKFTATGNGSELVQPLTLLFSDFTIKTEDTFIK